MSSIPSPPWIILSFFRWKLRASKHEMGNGKNYEVSVPFITFEPIRSVIARADWPSHSLPLPYDGLWFSCGWRTIYVLPKAIGKNGNMLFFLSKVSSVCKGIRINKRTHARSFMDELKPEGLLGGSFSDSAILIKADVKWKMKARGDRRQKSICVNKILRLAFYSSLPRVGSFVI